MYKIKDKKNLKRVDWRLNVGQEDRTRITSLVFVFAYFLRFIFFLASILFNTIHLCFSVCVDIIFRSYIGLPAEKLPQDVGTRWNLTHNMLSKAIPYKEAINRFIYRIA